MLQEDYTGKTIDDYTLLERIGRGGMAGVYRARQQSSGREVAIKIISLDPLLDMGEQQEFRQRFSQEAQVIASLEHVHILPVYSYGTIERYVAYLTMRLMSGGTLEDRLQDGPLPLQRVVPLFAQIAAALDYAHRQGVIHRDLKPSNILFDSAENAYLADFGLAKILESTQHITRSGMLVGTPVYVAPEQITDGKADHRADLYSLGVLLYHLLVGHPPFQMDKGGVLELIRQHVESAPPPPRNQNPSIPPAVETVILRALEKDPEKRFVNARQMAQALSDAAGIEVSLPGSRITLQRMLIFIPLLLVILLVAAGVMVSNSRPPAPLRPTIIPNSTASTTEITASEAEIAQVRDALGQEHMIALVSCNLSTELNATRARQMNDLAHSFNLPFRVYDSENQRERQPVLIAEALADGARGIILCPLAPETLHESLVALRDQGIPLVLVSPLENSYGGVTVTWDNVSLGEAVGNYTGEMIQAEMGGRADVLMIDFPTLPGIVVRAEAMEQALLETAPNARIVGRLNGEGIRETAYQVVKAALDAGMNFDVIMAINDASAFGAITALEEAGIAPDEVATVSINGETLALEYIANGYYMRGTVPNNITESVRGSLHAMIKLLANGTLSETLLVPSSPAITRESLNTR